MLTDTRVVTEVIELTDAEIDAVAGGASLVHVNNVRLANKIDGNLSGVTVSINL